MRFEMTNEQHKKLLNACEPVPMIMLQCGRGPSQQEMANAAWKSLGDVLGFDHPVHGKHPAFCFKPEECKGKSCCPRQIACSN